MISLTAYHTGLCFNQNLSYLLISLEVNSTRSRLNHVMISPGAKLAKTSVL